MTIEDIVRGIVREELAALKGDAPASTPAATEPPKRGRGRPAKGEGAPAASAAPATSPEATEADPFASEAPAAPAVTLDQVREALVALKNRSDQATALKVLAAAGGGAKTLGDLKADLYGAVVAAAQAHGAPPADAPAESDDPFATPAAPAQEAVPTAEELKALVIATGKRTSQDIVQKVVMKHGGKAPDPAGGPEKPSFKALPATAYLAVAAELKALPSTK